MHFVGVIPARFNSSRLPGKPLIEIAGRPLVQWVYLRATQSARLNEVLVATDDERIASAVESFGGRVLMTRSDHISGTDRVAEVARLVQADVFVNIQGDEPLISPLTIDEVCIPLEEQSTLQVTTARVRITDREEMESPHVVKVVVDLHQRALYFSRAAIPYRRESNSLVYKHLGIYAYRRELLQAWSELGPSPLERAECLEQLRLLENGIHIQAVLVQEDSLGVDTHEDLERVRPLLENEPKL